MIIHVQDEILALSGKHNSHLCKLGSCAILHLQQTLTMTANPINAMSALQAETHSYNTQESLKTTDLLNHCKSNHNKKCAAAGALALHTTVQTATPPNCRIQTCTASGLFGRASPIARAYPWCIISACRKWKTRMDFLT